MLAGSEDDRRIIEAAIAEISGRRLTTAAVTGPGFALHLDFQNLSLHASPPRAEDLEPWHLFMPDGYVLVPAAHGRNRRCRASLPWPIRGTPGPPLATPVGAD